MMLCSIEGCRNKHFARGWCNTHYYRWRRHGDPLAARHPLRQRPLHLRLITSLETPCREWWGQHDKDGYGRLDRQGASRRVHVWVWEQVNGPVPRGVFVLHRCDNPPCFRYDHLFAGDVTDNAVDMMAKGRGRGQFAAGFDERRFA